MDNFKEINDRLEEVNKKRKIYDWIGASLIVAFVFWGLWFFQQPAARAYTDILSNKVNNQSLQKISFLGQGGCCNQGNSGSTPIQSCGQGSGTCGMNGASVVKPDLTNVQEEAKTYYAANFNNGDEGFIEVVATDYGCHIQADIYKNGQLIKSLGYGGPGQFYEIN
ncbi:MAG: hypothetical protein ACOYVD_19385 [Bacillota bacterium]